jgi:hypothetical protein
VAAVDRGFGDGAARPRTLSLFPEDRVQGLPADASIVGVRLSELRLRRPRQWGACWLALMLWRELQLDQFWSKRLGVSRKGTHWDQVLLVLVAYRLLAPGSEWRLHREWFQRSALADLLGEGAGLAEIHKLYRCHDRLLVHKQAVFDHLVGRWRDLFNISYDVLLYDLTSTYFEADPPFPEGDKRRFWYSRDHRPDCVQIIIALVVTPEGLPLTYEVLPGNTADKTTLRGFLEREFNDKGGGLPDFTNFNGRPRNAIASVKAIAIQALEVIVKIRDALLNGPLGFGAAPLGNMFRNISDEEATATVDAAWGRARDISTPLPYTAPDCQKSGWASSFPSTNATNTSSAPTSAGSYWMKSRTPALAISVRRETSSGTAGRTRSSMTTPPTVRRSRSRIA